MDKILFIDGHSILNRAFYGVPELTTSGGLHTNAVYGFLTILLKVLGAEEADHLAVAFDLKPPTFRHKMYADYKGTRKPMPPELSAQVPVMKELLAAMGVPVLSAQGYEADDVLGTAARLSVAAGAEVVILSGDRDLLQLADEHVKIQIPRTVRGATEVRDFYPEDVRREYGVTPREFIDVKALMGDSSDNIPGVPSIGEKTATNLIRTYGSIENAFAHVDEIRPPRAQKALREHYDLAVLSKELATIRLDAPVEFVYEDTAFSDLLTPEAGRILRRLEFKSLLPLFEGTKHLPQEKSPVTAHFHLVAEAEAAGAVLSRAGRAGRIGFQFIAEGKETAGLAVCFGEEEIYAIRAAALPAGELERWLLKLLTEERAAGGYFAAAIDLKAQLPFLEAVRENAAPAGRESGAGGGILPEAAPGAVFEDLPGVMDAGVAAYLLNPLKSSYAYDDIAQICLGETFPSKMELIGRAPLGREFLSGNTQAADCACYMACTAYRAMPVLLGQLAENGMDRLFREIEMPLLYSLYRMERAGIRADKEQLAAYGARLTGGISALEQEIYALAGQRFNINSPKQLGEVLFEKLGLPHRKKTKTGYSTAAGVLEKLAPEHPIVQKILDYRQLTKLNSTYAQGLSVCIQEDGRIHGTFNQTITATGRISSTEPNLQNIPVRMELGREIRRVFVPADGYVFVDADYSQIELRILAHLSGDERLIAAYQKAQDIHAITASEVFHIPLAEVTPAQRRSAKAVNFGIIYGISAFGLSEDLCISRKEALDTISRYFETYPGVKAFLDGQVAFAKENGYVRTLYGRQRPVPELTSSNFAQRSFGERVAMNAPVQGTAADIMKIAMVAVDAELRRRGLRSRIVLQVHDELLVEAWEPELAAVQRLLVEKMKGAADLAVTLEVEAHSGASWFDAK